MEIVHRDEKGKVLERRSRERGDKTAVKGKIWLRPGKGQPPGHGGEPPGHGGEIPGKGHGVKEGDQPADRWVRVGKDRVRGLDKSDWKEEKPVPNREDKEWKKRKELK